MRQTYEVGDVVCVKSTKEYGVCYTNKSGGTSEKPIGKTFKCEIIRAWGDYEIGQRYVDNGQRYVGKLSNGQEIYFGSHWVDIEMAEA